MLCLLPECEIWLGYQSRKPWIPKKSGYFCAASLREADFWPYPGRQAGCWSWCGCDHPQCCHGSLQEPCWNKHENKPGTRNGHVAWPWLVCSLHSKKSLPIAGGKTSIPLQVCTLERKYILYINMSMTVYVNSCCIWFTVYDFQREGEMYAMGYGYTYKLRDLILNP